MKSFFFSLIVLCAVSFLLHFAWESSHVSLYGGYEHWSGDTPVTLLATGGDVLYTLLAVFFLAFIKRRLNLLYHVRGWDLFSFVFLGFFLALLVEYKGLALSRWQYLDTMPIIPYLGVGLSPILEMSILLPLSVFITWLIVSRFGR